MKPKKLIALAAPALVLVSSYAANQPADPPMPLAIHAETLYTLEGPALKNALVLVRDGKITYVGAADRMYSADHRSVHAKVVVPGLIDARATVGLSGVLNQPHDQDMLERSSPVSPELRALDAFNARDPLVEWVRSFGVTTLHTGHAPGSLISGQTIIIKTSGQSVEKDIVDPAAMTAVAIGNSALSRAEPAGGASAAKGPGSRAKAIAMLRAELIKAQEYSVKRNAKDESKRPARDLKMEALQRALDGSQRLLITAHRHHDIVSALRLAQEFKLKIVLDGCSDAHLVLDEIKQSGFPVILHPTMARANDDMQNLAMDTAAKLKEAGILFALQSGFESYVPKTRVILFEAAMAASRGLGFENALRCVTVDAARILGIEKRTGTIAVGKDADLALYDGDPFEYTTHAVGTVVSGVLFQGDAE